MIFIFALSSILSIGRSFETAVLMTIEKIKKKKKLPIIKYVESSVSIRFKFINITINKNKTAIAPTYIISMKIPIKSPFNKIKRIEFMKKIKIKKKTELTGLFESSINKELIINKKQHTFIRNDNIRKIDFVYYNLIVNYFYDNV